MKSYANMFLSLDYIMAVSGLQKDELKQDTINGSIERNKYLLRMPN